MKQQIMTTKNMNNETTTGEYMLLFRGPQWDKGLSPEQLQQAMNKVMAWFEALKEAGKIKASQPLGAQGRIISGKSDGLVADGPFAESKEAVGGYLLLLADKLSEAVEIARSNPALKYGVTVEVRPVLAECPILERHPELVERAKEQLWAAAAA
jgi:hypothetical protein